MESFRSVTETDTKMGAFINRNGSFSRLLRRSTIKETSKMWFSGHTEDTLHASKIADSVKRGATGATKVKL